MSEHILLSAVLFLLSAGIHIVSHGVGSGLAKVLKNVVASNAGQWTSLRKSLHCLVPMLIRLRYLLLWPGIIRSRKIKQDQSIKQDYTCVRIKQYPSIEQDQACDGRTKRAAAPKHIWLDGETFSLATARFWIKRSWFNDVRSNRACRGQQILPTITRLIATTRKRGT